MSDLSIYEQYRDSYRQSKRLVGSIAFFLLSLLPLSLLILTLKDPLPYYQTLMVTFFTITGLLFIGISMVSFFGFLCNLNNSVRCSKREVDELRRYASQDREVQTFVSRIMNVENRLPVADEYCQVVEWARSRNLS